MSRTLLRLILITVLLVALFGCGGGGGGGGSDSNGGSGSANAINVTPGQLEFRTFVTDTTYLTQEATIHVAFEGDGVIIGYAPGVAQPNWLYIPPGTITAPTKEFDLTLDCLPRVSQSTGTYNTSVRFLTGNADGSDPVYVDLPVQLIIEDQPPVYNGDIAFTATTADTLLPLPQNLALDFGSFTGADYSVAIESVNSFAHDWMLADPVTANEQLDVSIISNKPAGHYKANLIVTYQAAGATGKKSIGVDFTVAADKPSINYISPPFAYVGQSSEFIISGVGFTTESIQEITLGGTPATSYELTNDAEVRVRFPAFAASGIHSLVVSTASGTYTGPYDIYIKHPVNPVYTNIDMGSEILDFEFDALRDTLIAATATGLFRIQDTGSSWEAVTEQAINVPTFDLTPDGNHIVYSDGSQVYLLDAVTLAVDERYAFPALDTSGSAASYSYARVKNVLNNGDVLLAMRTDLQETYCTFHLPNQIFTPSENRSESTLTRMPTNREKSMIVPNAIRTNYAGYYMASSQTYEPITLPHDKIYTNRFAICGKGERLYLNDGVYDKDLNFLVGITDATVYNYSTALSIDGLTAYWIDGGDGKIHTYDVSASPATKLGVITFPDPYYSYAANPDSRITPGNEMMILGKGRYNASTRETRLVFVPLVTIE